MENQIEKEIGGNFNVCSKKFNLVLILPIYFFSFYGFWNFNFGPKPYFLFYFSVLSLKEERELPDFSDREKFLVDTDLDYEND